MQSELLIQDVEGIAFKADDPTGSDHPDGTALGDEQLGRLGREDGEAGGFRRAQRAVQPDTVRLLSRLRETRVRLDPGTGDDGILALYDQPPAVFSIS